MKFNKFEDILVWQKAVNLAVYIYSIFKDSQDYRFKSQIESATISISNNIAEGFERKSNKEFERFLFISKGSCAEVRSMSHVAIKLNYFEKEQYEYIHNETIEISKMLSGLIKTL